MGKQFSKEDLIKYIQWEIDMPLVRPSDFYKAMHQIKEVLGAMREPDPETGLMLCGCGEKPVLMSECVPTASWDRSARRCTVNYPESFKGQGFIFHRFFTDDGEVHAIIEDEDGRVLTTPSANMRFADRNKEER